MENKLKKISIIAILIILLFCCSLDLFSQFKTFTGINDTQFNYIDVKLEQLGFGKVTYYYNDLIKKDGRWELYPKILISDSIFAVSVSTIRGLIDKYSFIVFYDSKSNQVLDTLGPFFDTFTDAIKFKCEKGIITSMTVRLGNPPEPYDPRFTFIKYVRKNAKLIKVRSSDKY